MPNKFYIEYFTPKHLKNADELLDKQLKETQQQHKKLRSSIAASLKKPSLWNKVKHSLHLD